METLELHGPKAPAKMPMMKCGHRAQGYRTSPGEKIPACVICAGITPDAYIVVPEPNLSERKARCSTCSCEKASTANLAFFEYRPDQEHDWFYCGCRGWN